MSEDSALQRAFISALEQRAKQGELGTPLPQTQRELVPFASASLVPQTQPVQFSIQENEPALHAMIEYVRRLEELCEETAGKPEYTINQPFDTGIYSAEGNLPQQALYGLASLINEALAKKTLPRIGR